MRRWLCKVRGLDFCQASLHVSLSHGNLNEQASYPQQQQRFRLNNACQCTLWLACSSRSCLCRKEGLRLAANPAHVSLYLPNINEQVCYQWHQPHPRSATAVYAPLAAAGMPCMPCNALHAGSAHSLHATGALSCCHLASSCYLLVSRMPQTRPCTAGPLQYCARAQRMAAPS